MHRNWLICVIVLSVFVLSACNLPGVTVSSAPTLSQDAIFTAAAQTLAVQLTQSAATQMAIPPTVEIPPSQTPALPSDTPAAPSDTPTLAFTPTQFFTPTPNVLFLTASVGTNCRLGPSKLYDPPLGVLAKNEKAEVHGRNSDSSWWYIQLPSKPGVFCWVWAETTSVDGASTLLPVTTPPPLPPTATPTATPELSFSVSFENVHSCGDAPTAIFEVENISDSDLESLNLEIEDLTDDDTLFGPRDSDAPFMGSKSECPPGGDLLEAGDTLYIGGAIGGGNSGHTARATIELCTKDDLEGVCTEETVQFTIP